MAFIEVKGSVVRRWEFDVGGKLTNHLRILTSTSEWQKTWQKKTAAECRSVQMIADRRNARNPENAGKNAVS